MHSVLLPRIGAAQSWRRVARGFLSAGVPPDQIVWGDSLLDADLFAAKKRNEQSDQITVPKSFLAMASSIVWHKDPARFARLYAFLWRLKDAPQLMTDRGDAQLVKLRMMEKNVHRCQHKMKAFVRFREIGHPSDQRRSFAAWFEPTHHSVEPTSDFFMRRFADMDWRILTPDISAFYENGALRFEEDHPRPALPEDASETLWLTYFRNIFNPARLKVRAMQSEMPKKYWKNLPEAATIPDLIAGASARAREMALAGPSPPPERAFAAQAQQARLVSAWDGPAEELPRAIAACTRCALHCTATQAVPGEGPQDANIMIVGEQPGDHEDLCGRPFVGPAGQLFDTVAEQVGLNRSATFVTNAVKHFKFVPKGRRRIHRRPDAGEVQRCKWWLEAERMWVRPELVVAMGATAAGALTGSAEHIGQRRGTLEKGLCGVSVLITHHPSYFLRMPEGGSRQEAMGHFAEDLRFAARQQ